MAPPLYSRWWADLTKFLQNFAWSHIGMPSISCYGLIHPITQATTWIQANQQGVYPDCYLIDGPIVTGALGVNSSLTIAALAFQCAEKMAGSQLLPSYPDFLIASSHPSHGPLKQLLRNLWPSASMRFSPVEAQ